MEQTKFFFLIIILFLLSCETDLVNDLKISSIENTSQYQSDGEIILYPNTPNPFYPSTIITYVISDSMYVRLEVYTEEWEKMDILIDQFESRGPHQIIYNRADLPSGNYYYVLEAAGYRLIGIMKCVK